MKKLLFALAAVALMASSCSKESKLNKKLDGTWTVETVNGAALTGGASMEITFTKDKKGKGDYSLIFNMPPLPASTETGTYDLEKDEIIYMLASTAGSTQDTMNVVEYSKTAMTLKNPDGTETIVLKKK